MSKFLDFLDGKKTYLFLLLYVASSLASGQDIGFEVPENLPELSLAAAAAALRAGVKKVSG